MMTAWFLNFSELDNHGCLEWIVVWMFTLILLVLFHYLNLVHYEKWLTISDMGLYSVGKF